MSDRPFFRHFVITRLNAVITKIVKHELCLDRLVYLTDSQHRLSGFSFFPFLEHTKRGAFGQILVPPKCMRFAVSCKILGRDMSTGLRAGMNLQNVFGSKLPPKCCLKHDHEHARRRLRFGL